MKELPGTTDVSLSNQVFFVNITVGCAYNENLSGSFANGSDFWEESDMMD
jgi:hypothetical protein